MPYIMLELIRHWYKCYIANEKIQQTALEEQVQVVDNTHPIRELLVMYLKWLNQCVEISSNVDTDLKLSNSPYLQCALNICIFAPSCDTQGRPFTKCGQLGSIQLSHYRQQKEVYRTVSWTDQYKQIAYIVNEQAILSPVYRINLQFSKKAQLKQVLKTAQLCNYCVKKVNYELDSHFFREGNMYRSIYFEGKEQGITGSTFYGLLNQACQIVF